MSLLHKTLCHTSLTLAVNISQKQRKIQNVRFFTLEQFQIKL